MKLFVCQSCQQLLYFENSQCVRCGHELGFLPEITWLSALEPAGGESWTALAAPGRSWRRCANAVHGSCNWMVPADADTPFCVACRHNRTIPDLTVPENLEAWQRLEIAKHRLKKEIIATVITNSIVNRTGITFVHGLAEDTGFSPSEIASAYIAARDAFGLRNIWREIEALDGKIPVDTQVNLFLEVNRFIEQMTRWFLQQMPHPMDITATINEFAPHIKTYAQSFHSVLSEAAMQTYERRLNGMKESGVPEALAERIASLEPMSIACDIVRVSLETKEPVKAVAKLYYEIAAMLQLSWLRDIIDKANTESHWDRLAVKSLIDELMRELRRLTLQVLKQKKGPKGTNLENWMQQNADDIERLHQLMQDLKSSDKRDLPMLVIAMKALGAVG